MICGRISIISIIFNSFRSFDQGDFSKNCVTEGDICALARCGHKNDIACQPFRSQYYSSEIFTH